MPDPLIPRPTLVIARQLLWMLPNGVPNTADGSSGQSKAIAARLIEIVSEEAAVIGLGLAPQTSGTHFEDAVRDFLAKALPPLAPSVELQVERGIGIHRYLQYRHLDEVATLVASDPTGLLRDALGTEYLVRPDVTVGHPDPLGVPFLHASVSCKWTIRSDRVQNARHEANVLIRHRRGRCPHIVVVTAEPLPTRLASIAQGTGEIDRTYHLALPELKRAVEEVGSTRQKQVLAELIANDRLADLNDLPTPCCSDQRLDFVPSSSVYVPMNERPQPWCPRCGDVKMLGGNAPGASYWVCPNCRRDLRVGFEEGYLETPEPHRSWRPGDQSNWKDRVIRP